MITVKDLVWEAEDNGWWSARAGAFPGGYEVRETDRGGVRVRSISGSWESFDGTLDEAKASHQADYDRRIRSGLKEDAQ